jgi:hypothetical protein
LSSEDTPSDLLDASVFVEVTRSDEFRTYVMFRSDKPGSIPVALGRLEWNWKGTAVLDKKQWTLKSGSDSFSKDPAGVKIASVPQADRLPVWSKSITN